MTVGRDQYDVIVVGAGLAGLACAGELILAGQRPLLVCETKEVASTMRSTMVAGNRAVPQVPTWNHGWGGGWWMSLAKAFNLPIQYHPEPGLDLTVFDGRVAGEVKSVPRCPTASGLTQMLLELSPWPVDALRPEFEQIMQAALAIPYGELCQMEQVPVGEWLAGLGVSDPATLLAQVLLAAFTMVDVEVMAEQISVFGALGYLRGYLGGEGMIPVIYPDNRDGLAIPLAQAIEAHGGDVWRSRRVRQIITEDGVATGVLFEDGSEVSAPVVALAVGNSRLPGILDPLPAELEAPLASSLGMVDFYTYTALSRPVASDRAAFLGVLDETGALISFSWPMQAIAPWTTQPGQQLIVATSAYSPKKLAALGGAAEAYARLDDIHEVYFPGFKAAIIEQKTQSHTHLWYDQLSAGPKVPRTIESVRNLWFVGEGSTPIAGVGFEAAASAGILGARGIAQHLRSLTKPQ